MISIFNSFKDTQLKFSEMQQNFSHWSLKIWR